MSVPTSPAAMRLAFAGWLLLGCSESFFVAGGDGGVDGDRADMQVPVCSDGTVQCGLKERGLLRCVDGAWQYEPCGETEYCSGGMCVSCGSVQFGVATYASCELSLLLGTELDGEGFVWIQGVRHRVFALDRWGEGHVIAWCDATSLGSLLAAFNVAGYLGQTEQPRVASVGDVYLCEPPGAGTSSGAMALPSWLVYLGAELPSQYQNDPALLAEEWDAIVFCGFRASWTHDWSPELRAFVSEYGKGFLAVMEYHGVASDEDFQRMNAIVEPTGLVFDATVLEWADATADITVECVPDLPPVE